jgi:hypothetical protein
MGNGRLLGLLTALILSAGSLCAQDSGGDGSGSSDSGSSDSSSSDTGLSDNSDAASDPTDITDPTVTDPTNQNALDNLDNFAAHQARDAITTPWGGVPAPAPATNLVVGPGGNSVPGGAGEPTQPSEPVAPITGFPPARRAEIHAVIVSNLSDPSQVLFRERQL